MYSLLYHKQTQSKLPSFTLIMSFNTFNVTSQTKPSYNFPLNFFYYKSKHNKHINKTKKIIVVMSSIYILFLTTSKAPRTQERVNSHVTDSILWDYEPSSGPLCDSCKRSNLDIGVGMWKNGRERERENVCVDLRTPITYKTSNPHLSSFIHSPHSHLVV